MTQGELGAFVQSHLREKGIDVVLSGGASVSIYSSNQYVSPDLDFVNVSFVKRHNLRESMNEIGFHEEGRYFKHPETTYFVEFPPGPLSIGDEPVKEIVEIEFPTGILRLISPTECVKDRLAAFYYWDDQQCLVQAILVSQVNEIDIDEIERWSEVGGMLEKFQQIKDKLIGKSK
jgi:hypothetical protein